MNLLCLVLSVICMDWHSLTVTIDGSLLTGEDGLDLGTLGLPARLGKLISKEGLARVGDASVII